jgi:hypothetical protein
VGSPDSVLETSQLPQAGGSSISHTGTVPIKSEAPNFGDLDYMSRDASPHPDLSLNNSAAELNNRQHDLDIQTDPLAPESDTNADRQHKNIQPNPLVQEPNEDGPGEVIHLPKLEMTQHFLDTLWNSTIEGSVMQPDDIEALCNPSPVLDMAASSQVSEALY